MALRQLTEPEDRAVRSLKVALSPRAVRLITKRIDLRAEKARIEHELAQLDEKIKPLVDEYGGKIECDEWTATHVTAENSSISKEKLLSLGVKPTIIAKASKVTPYSYVKITLKSREKGQVDEA